MTGFSRGEPPRSLDIENPIRPVEDDSTIVQHVSAQEHIRLVRAGQSFDLGRREVMNPDLYQVRSDYGEMAAHTKDRHLAQRFESEGLDYGKGDDREVCAGIDLGRDFQAHVVANGR